MVVEHWPILLICETPSCPATPHSRVSAIANSSGPDFNRRGPLGSQKRIVWHTRSGRTCASLLKSSGSDVKVAQEPLRHANARTTMEPYVQAPAPDKRLAQSKVIEMMRLKLALPSSAAC
jgi:hypothetical protein